MPQVSKSPWLPFAVSPGARIALLCLPHAGAGAGSYRAWGAGLAPHVGAYPVQPPGREKRRNEAPIREVARYVRELAPEITARLDTPYAVFGHSTGAICAFELVREFRRLGWALPERLFVAGRRAPHLPMPRHRLEELPIEEVAEFLGALGGTPPEVLTDHLLLKQRQPLMGADFQVNEEYPYQLQEPLPVPITAFAATEDEWSTPDLVKGWVEHTSADFEMCTLSGGHFAIFEQAETVHDVITTRLTDPSRGPLPEPRP
ncbi:alpha/beta fold hydrolase [Streptomyces sp. NPDC048279]|uniref:thioesterase II family protein n=1 Tax=Streptomyces sp. NPDC048279 TaxID=3154714 RepID=UPI0034427F85